MLVILLSSSLSAASLKVELTNLKSDKGTIRYLLFKDGKGYPDDPSKSIKQGSFPAKQKAFEVDDVPQGKYALTLIHDENNNGELDKNMGIPVEGFGFSKNPVILFGPPAFKKVSIKLPKVNAIKIRMNYL